VDYYRLNAETRKDSFPIPRTQDCLDAVAGAKIVSILDMTSGYHQIPVRKEDIPKTAFVTKYGLHECTTMQFGLTNAPATFQRLMQIAVKGLQWETCLIYLDDIVVYGSDFDKSIVTLRVVFERIRLTKLKLKAEKCSLFQEEVCFLGHTVSEHGILPNPDNVAKVQQWPEPSTVTEVRQFLGLCSYYRRFVINFSKIAYPLTELTKKDTTLVWTSECQEAFDKLKDILTGPDIMAYPLDEGLYILDTDACDVSIGAVLSQV
jgi:hypothetical protein